MVVEQARFQCPAGVSRRDQREQFVGGEPQAGQGKAAVGGVVAVAAAFLVVDERGVEFVTQVGDQTAERGACMACSPVRLARICLSVGHQAGV